MAVRALDSSEPPHARASWLLVSITSIVYIAVIALQTLKGSTDSIPIRIGGTAAGPFIFTTLVILSFSIWKRFRNSRSRYRIALAAGIWLLVGAAAPSLQHGSHYAAQKRIVEADLRDAIALVESRGEALLTNQILPPYTPPLHATGYWGDVERLWMAALSQGVALREPYETELVGMRLHKVLASGWSTNGPNLAESKRILKQAQATQARYDELSNELIARLPALVEAIPLETLTTKQKEAVFQGVRESLPKILVGLHEVWKAESAIISELSAMVDLLDHSRGRWREDNGKLVFAHVEDQSAHEAHRHTASEQKGRVVQRSAAAFAPVFAMLRS